MGEKCTPGTYWYLEFTTGRKPKYGDKTNYVISGIYLISEVDRWNILIKEEEIEILVPKSRIIKHEPVTMPVVT